jgi:hypothetical protein
MKTILRILILLTLYIIISFFISIKIDDFFTNTLYTVSGIMFSVGLGLIVTFSLNGVKNKIFIKQLRENVNNVRNSFLINFLLSTICFVVDYYLRKKVISVTEYNFYSYKVEFNWSILCCIIMLFSVVYYINNFIQIQKLNNEIFDKVNE